MFEDDTRSQVPDEPEDWDALQEDDEEEGMDEAEFLATVPPEAHSFVEMILKDLKDRDNPMAMVSEALDGMSNLDEWGNNSEYDLASHFRAIGFPVYEPDEVYHLITKMIADYEENEVEHGTIYSWRDASGAEVWVHVADRHITGVEIHFDGAARMEMSLLNASPSDNDPLGGCFHGWAAPARDYPEVGRHPIAFDVPDFGVHTALELPVVCPVQVVAIVHRLAAYPNEDVFYETQEKPVIADTAYFPMGTQAVFSGGVSDCAQLTNALSGSTFFWARVMTLGGEVNVIAEPAVVQGEIVTGGIVKGSFCLSGRLMEA